MLFNGCSHYQRDLFTTRDDVTLIARSLHHQNIGATSLGDFIAEGGIKTAYRVTPSSHGNVVITSAAAAAAAAAAAVTAALLLAAALLPAVALLLLVLVLVLVVVVVLLL